MGVTNAEGSSATNYKLNKPEIIITDKQLMLFSSNTDIKLTIKTLEAGHPVLITAFYSNGLSLLKALKVHLQKKYINKSFKEQREYRSKYNKLSQLILIEVINYKLVVKKAPFIGWLEKLYPETSDFLLPFVKIQGLNSAWQWYENGISIPVLRNKIYPFYGTYFPTRFDHLILFDNWLNRYDGPKKNAIDVGIGSGVLSFQMLKHGFQKVYGTDTNPNAIVGLTNAIKDTKLSRKITLDFGHLFANANQPTELIVFNPPWLPQSSDLNMLDEAIYYDKNLFPQFFKKAKPLLLPEGRFVLIFYNLAQTTKVTKQHPIELELAEGGRFILEKCLKRNVKMASGKTKRDQHWRTEEAVELWVLKHVK